LAEKLGKTFEEIEQIRVSEYHGWLAYYEHIGSQNDTSTNNKDSRARPNQKGV
jgi:hypothetical protein